MIWMNLTYCRSILGRHGLALLAERQPLGPALSKHPKIGAQAVIVGSDARALTVHGDRRVSLRQDLAAPDLRKPALPHYSFGDHYGEASASAAEKQEGILVGSWRLFQ